MRDPRVEAAISHWAPRFVANGVPLADFQEVTASCERWEDWCSRWSARAAIHEELAAAALSQGNVLTAAGHYTRAAVCYHFGKFLFVIEKKAVKSLLRPLPGIPLRRFKERRHLRQISDFALKHNLGRGSQFCILAGEFVLLFQIFHNLRGESLQFQFREPEDLSPPFFLQGVTVRRID